MHSMCPTHTAYYAMHKAQLSLSQTGNADEMEIFFYMPNNTIMENGTKPVGNGTMHIMVKLPPVM